MDKIRKPGYETTKQLWSPNPKHLQKFVDKKIIPFLNVKRGAFCFDMGERNPRMDYIKERLDLDVLQFDNNDFNFDMSDTIEKADVVFAFEVIEHLQNPLWFMRELKKLTDGSIYVIIPCNPRWLWHEMHFFEMNRKHFEKWILKPLDLEIVRYKKINFVASWKTYLIGLRPLIKLLTGKTTFKNFIRSLFYVQYGIYEIRKV
jgi:hypothetical protein